MLLGKTRSDVSEILDPLSVDCTTLMISLSSPSLLCGISLGHGSRFDVQNVRSRPEADILTLEPAPHTRAVVAIDVAELALEIGFLTRYYAVADDEGERC